MILKTLNVIKIYRMINSERDPGNLIVHETSDDRNCGSFLFSNKNSNVTHRPEAYCRYWFIFKQQINSNEFWQLIWAGPDLDVLVAQAQHSFSATFLNSTNIFNWTAIDISKYHTLRTISHMRCLKIKNLQKIKINTVTIPDKCVRKLIFIDNS